MQTQQQIQVPSSLIEDGTTQLLITGMHQSEIDMSLVTPPTSTTASFILLPKRDEPEKQKEGLTPCRSIKRSSMPNRKGRACRSIMATSSEPGFYFCMKARVYARSSILACLLRDKDSKGIDWTLSTKQMFQVKRMLKSDSAARHHSHHSSKRTTEESDASHDASTKSKGISNSNSSSPAKEDFQTLDDTSVNNIIKRRSSLTTALYASHLVPNRVLTTTSRRISTNAPHSTCQCSSCGAKITPYWRDGWSPEIMLCNACGLRFQKFAQRCPSCAYIPRKEDGQLSVCPQCTRKWDSENHVRNHLQPKVN